MLDDAALVSFHDSSYCFEIGRVVGAMIEDLSGLTPRRR